jgi:Tfp pilus assembly protein PilF
MSLLLEALKPAQSGAAAVIEPQAFESTEPDIHETPLDARATLELLAPTDLPDPGAIPEGPAAPAAEPPAAIRAEAVTARAAVAAEAPAAAPTQTRPPVAPAAAPGLKRYTPLLAALLALAILGVLVKMLWGGGSTAVTYPEGSEGSMPSAAAVSNEPATTPVALNAVQPASSRPADQFAYAGNAPEIDLTESDAHPSVVAAGPAGVAAAAPAAESDAGSAPSAPTPAGVTAKAAFYPSRTGGGGTLSVSRTKGQSLIDRHVQAGYRALGSGDVARARQEYLAAVDIDPNNVDALMGAATVAAREGKPAAAAAAYAQVLKLEPGNPNATAAMTMLTSDTAAGESNESRLKVLIADGGGDEPTLHAALAGVYAAEARWAEAAQEYFAALGKDSGNPDLAFNVAASLDQDRKAAAALKFYQQALEYARQRPAQFDVHAAEQRVSQLLARGPSTSGAR